MIAQAAVSHLGAALLPRFLIEQELAAGSLVELSDLVLTSTDAYYLVYPRRARSRSGHGVSGLAGGGVRGAAVAGGVTQTIQRRWVGR